MPMEIDQRRAGQRRGFDADPQQAEMLADRDQRHRRQEQQQAAGKDRLGLVGKEQVLLEVDVRDVVFLAEIAQAIDRGGQKQHAGDREKQQAQAVQLQPAVPHRRGQLDPAGGRQSQVDQRREDQQHAASGVGTPAERNQAGHERHADQGKNHRQDPIVFCLETIESHGERSAASHWPPAIGTDCRRFNP